jgi:hypothetical protein
LVQARSIKEDREYDGELVKTAPGHYRYAPGRSGTQSHGSPINDQVPGFAGWYHSHGADSHGKYDDEHFSPDDKTISDDTRTPGFVITPHGRMFRYDPDPKKNHQGPVSKIGP